MGAGFRVQRFDFGATLYLRMNKIGGDEMSGTFPGLGEFRARMVEGILCLLKPPNL